MAFNYNRAVLYLGLMVLMLICSSCMGEAKEKLKKAKQGVSNMGTVVEKAQEAKKDIERLKDATPLTNKELKSWLPEMMGDMGRTGFKVGTSGYANVASVEGTFRKEVQEKPGPDDSYDGGTIEKKLIVKVIDGAGPSGSMMIAGLGMAATMDMEQEDEYKHVKAVNVDGIHAQQTFHKKRNETALQFVYGKRFGIMVNGVNMNPNETWNMVDKLHLGGLIDLTE